MAALPWWSGGKVIRLCSLGLYDLETDWSTHRNKLKITLTLGMLSYGGLRFPEFKCK